MRDKKKREPERTEREDREFDGTGTLVWVWIGVFVGLCVGGRGGRLVRTTAHSGNGVGHKGGNH